VVLTRWDFLSILIVCCSGGLYLFGYLVVPFQYVNVSNGTVFFSARFHGHPNLSFVVNMSDLGLSGNASQYRLIAEGLPVYSSSMGSRYAYLWTFVPDVSRGAFNVTFYPVYPDLLQTDFFLSRRLDVCIRVV